MAKKSEKSNAAFRKLKEDLETGSLGNAYIFHGEESYLREYYLGEMKKVLIPPGFESFNYHMMEGKGLSVQELTEVAEAMPMMAERTMIQVTDPDLFRLNEEQRERLIALLEDLPPYCCIVFVYTAGEYKPDRTKKKLLAAVEKYVQTVEFLPADNSDLVPWIIRRFKALDKAIERPAAEYLIFLCGGLMTGLIPEIGKIAAYAKGKTVTEKDIDAVATPILSAEIFKLTDAVLKGNYNEAARILGDLLKMQEEPLMISAALGSQLRRIYTARLAIDSGKDKYWLMDLWGAKSDYPVKMWLSAAKQASRDWCSEAVKQCQDLDRRLKSERGIDAEDELKLLLVRLGALRV